MDHHRYLRMRKEAKSAPIEEVTEEELVSRLVATGLSQEVAKLQVTFSKALGSSVLVLPEEVWALTTEYGFLAVPVDDDGTNVFLCWPTEAEAKKGAKHQIERGYYAECTPLRLK